MVYVVGGMGVVTVLAIVFAARCYVELWKWARQCQQAQIAVSYKRKVVLVAPLVEWLLWCNQLRENEANGRVIYRMGQTSVALIKKRSTVKRAILASLRIGMAKQKRTGAPPVKQGTWSAEDQTPQANKQVVR